MALAASRSRTRPSGLAGIPCALPSRFGLLLAIPLAILVAIPAGAQAPPPAPPSPAPSPPASVPDPSQTPAPAGTADPAAAAGEPVDPHVMTEGKIPVLNLLRFLQSATGKLVNYPSSAAEPAFAPEVTVEVLGDVSPLTLPIVRAILETNGYELWEQELEDGSLVINVRSNSARAITPPSAETPIIEPGEATPQENNEELATLVLQLKYTDTGVVTQALRELLDIQGGGAGRNAGAIKMVAVPSSETLILRAKVGILEHIQRLVEFIDVEVVGPEPILEVRELNFADAQDLVSIIQEALDTSGAAATARRTQRAARGQPQQQQQPSSQMAGDATRLISDPRTQKIIIQSTDEDEVDLVHHLIDELDTKVRSIRRNTWTYRVKALKAEDLADVLQQLIEGTQGSLRGNRGAAGGATQDRTARAQQQGVQQQQQNTPTRIVPHPQTNMIIIQAEPEEWVEIERILDDIDRRRRQVFLEAALVQVTDSSNLNYTIEFLAGNLDDQATRLAAMSAFGLSTLDTSQLPDNFVRAFPGTGSGTGLLAAISSDGQLPVLLRAIKSDTDSQILATPFILADDNEESSITVDTEIFFETSNTTNVNTTTGQASESAGIRMTLTPTISQDVVLLSLSLEVSSFAGASSSTGTLPDKSTNTIVSNVTIPDGSLFIIGGLARENESTVVDKVPFLGDLPFLGRLFQSRGTEHSRDNLYVFLTAHIIDDDRAADLELLSDQAVEGVRSFGEVMRLNSFELPNKTPRDAERAPPEAAPGEVPAPEAGGTAPAPPAGGDGAGSPQESEESGEDE